MGLGFRVIVVMLLWAVPVVAQPLSGLARFDGAASSVTDRGQDVVLRLALSQPVPFRLSLMAAPPRFLADFNTVDWGGQPLQALDQSDGVDGLAAGPFANDWSRLAMVLSGPMVVRTAQMQVDEASGRAMLEVILRPASDEEFAARAVADDRGASAAPVPRHRQDGSRPLRVVLDPGHGGIDPGAERGGLREADLMLSFARELQEVLRRAGVQVTMTREADVFVPLETRISVAHAVQADVFLSLHADALAEGRASGATIYTLSDSASDEASAKLAERHDRADLLAGVDLTDHDDVVAGVLMDLARLETAPRSEDLADALVRGLRKSVGGLHKRPRLRAGFSVLKSPAVPSVLVELGFLSSERDRKRLTDAVWRRKAASGIRDALLSWAVEDAAEAELLRQ